MLSKFSKLVKDKMGIDLHPHQAEAIKLGLETDKGVFEVGTGGGKSIIMAGLAFRDRTLIVVDSIDLLVQTSQLIRRLYGDDATGEYGGGVHKWGRITVGIPRSLQNSPLELRGFNRCIWDECHTGIGFNKEYTPNHNLLDMATFPTIHGFTGTYIRRTKEEETALRELFGPPLMRIGTSDLIASGALPIPHIYMLDCPCPEAADAVAVAIANEWKDKKGLILTRQVKRCQRLAKELEVPYCHGTISKTKRKTTIDDLANGKIRAIVATKVFEKGVDIPAIDYAINLKNEIGEVGCRQSIGRILRGSSSKTYVDFLDNSLAASNRFRIYNEEWGFEVTRLSIGEMLDSAQRMMK